jgi:hypothetical protein
LVPGLVSRSVRTPGCPTRSNGFRTSLPLNTSEQVRTRTRVETHADTWMSKPVQLVPNQSALTYFGVTSYPDSCRDPCGHLDAQLVQQLFIQSGQSRPGLSNHVRIDLKGDLGFFRPSRHAESAALVLQFLSLLSHTRAHNFRFTSPIEKRSRSRKSVSSLAYTTTLLLAT